VDPHRARGGRAVAALDGPRRRLRPLDLFLIAEFTFISFRYYLPLGYVGDKVDAASYWGAANRWLAGLDPYADLGGLMFAAPPPTLAVLAPFALLPLPVFAALMLGASVAAAVYLLRRLGLPYWFLLFPPLVEALLVGNPDVLVVALLVAAKPATDIVAAFLKVYAVLPIALLDRRRSIVWIALAVVVTAPFLPWASYVTHATQLVGVLNEQANGGRSALAYPLLVPIAIAALVVVGRRKAAWLIVPALWPATQHHYSVLALPASSRVMAAFLALPIPGAPVAAAVAGALTEWHLRSQRQVRERLREVPST
jgi:hypothetical protein